MRILVVEDDERVAEQMIEALTGAGYGADRFLQLDGREFDAAKVDQVVGAAGERANGAHVGSAAGAGVAVVDRVVANQKA